jgi:hypothetical protein
MVMYIVGTVAFILGANIGVLLALLLLHGKAESLAARNARIGISEAEQSLVEQPMTVAYL